MILPKCDFFLYKSLFILSINILISFVNLLLFPHPQVWIYFKLYDSSVSESLVIPIHSLIHIEVNIVVQKW